VAESWVDTFSGLYGPTDRLQISIELDNGFRVSGVGDIETLRLLFRDPDRLTQVVSADSDLPVSIVLPPGKLGPMKCDFAAGITRKSPDDPENES
jgi:hypothetical protein